MTTMRDWFQKLAPREQLLVSVAAVLLVMAMIVTLGIRPIISSTSKGHERVEEKRKLLLEIEQVAERIGPQATGGQIVASNGNQSLVVIVDSTTRNNGLAAYLKRNQPDGATSIRLRFENVPFDAIVAWLGSLQAQHGLIATTATIDKSGTPGRVNCNLTLSQIGG